MENTSERIPRPTLNASEQKENVAVQRDMAAQRRAGDMRRPELRDKKHMKKALVMLAGLVVLGGLVWWFFLRNIGIPSYVATDKYQVACLQSGECYFGKVTSVTSDVIVLKDVFYVQKSSQAAALDSKAAANNNLELIKLGNEVHGPEDMMVLTRSQVLYVENLKSDGKVTQTINSYHQQNK